MDCLPIYEAKIKELFQGKGISMELIKVEFDGKKAIVKFDKNMNNTTLMLDEDSTFDEGPNSDIIHEVSHFCGKMQLG